MTKLAIWWATAPAPPPVPGSDRGEEFGKTSPIALVVILLLGLATVLLIRSMTKRLRNVPASFDHPDSAHRAERTDQAAGPDAAEGGSPTGKGEGDRTEGPPPTGSP